MLRASDRTSLFEALRPPTGFRFDTAVATSFTLDLEALLTAPIAFARFDEEARHEDSEPIPILDAIRRYSEKLTLFVQAGQIRLPTRHRLLYAWLEESVVPVHRPRPGHLFHPKVWLVRYADESEKHLLRVICATRNLTFDSSWDTMLVIDSLPTAESESPAPGQDDLAVLFRSLANAKPIHPGRRRDIHGLCDLLEVSVFEVPKPFDSLRFHVLGTGRDPLPLVSEASMIVSPFLGSGRIAELVARHHPVVVSRPESLDNIGTGALADARRTAIIADLETSAAYEDNSADDADRPVAFGGLHAKLYGFDVGTATHIFTGSANATQAAFSGNTEVLVELVGPVEHGVRTLLEAAGGKGVERSFADLLVDYDPVPLSDEEESNQELTRLLDQLCVEVAEHEYVATAVEAGEGWELTLSTEQPVFASDGGDLDLSVRPLTLDGPQAESVEPGQPLHVTFRLSEEAITTFFALRLEVSLQGVRKIGSTLVNAALVGGPADRRARLLSQLLADSERFLRYLFLLLASEDDQYGVGIGAGGGIWRKWLGFGLGRDPSLLEPLVRMSQRDPERIREIARLLEDLGDQRVEVIPPGFTEVFEPILIAISSTTP